MGLGGDLGSTLGGAAGNYIQGLLGFKKGGRIPGKKGKAKLVIAHSGEYVLPVGIQPTKEQIMKVAKRHKK